jgi:Spy/CpxP family protein refolding chaperone
MARHSRWLIATFALVIAAVYTTQAHGPQTESGGQQGAPKKAEGQDGRRDGDHDRRIWWKDPKVIAEIGLTPDQSSMIDSIFKTEFEKMKPLRDWINTHERALNDTIRANTTDVAILRTQVEEIERKRAELNTIRTVMLYRFRRVLSADQNKKLHALFERREAERRRQDGDRRR